MPEYEKRPFGEFFFYADPQGMYLHMHVLTLLLQVN